MNSGPNSDSKRCPESELGQVHIVHTLDPGCAHTARELRRVVGLARPCHRRPLSCRRPCAARRVVHRIVAQGVV